MKPMGPRYPTYPSQPFTGRLPSMYEVGPSDYRYSSGTNPRFQTQIDRMHGRHLAGTDQVEVQDEDAQPGWAHNELKLYAEMDDVQANGIFDPPGSRSNIYPDAGVLSARFGIPGYLARERMFAESEVIDSTTGRPVVYVNGGAVSMDSAAQIAFLERGAYDPSDPVIGASRSRGTPFRSITNTRVNPIAIGPGQVRQPDNTYPQQSAAISPYPRIPAHSNAEPVEGLGVSLPTSGAIPALLVLGLIGIAAGGAYAVLKK
jgi:hypothetical protein